MSSELQLACGFAGFAFAEALYRNRAVWSSERSCGAEEFAQRAHNAHLLGSSVLERVRAPSLMRAVPHHERWSIHLAAVRNNPTLEYDIGHVGQPVRERGCAENVLSANARDTLVAIECDDLYRHAAPDCDRQEQTHTCYGHRTELMGRACSPGQEWHRGRHREKAYKPRPERGMSRNENVRCRALDPHRTIETT
jgi:hypothetical protein